MIFALTKIEMDDSEFAIIQADSESGAIEKFYEHLLEAHPDAEVKSGLMSGFYLVKRGIITTEWFIEEVVKDVHMG